MHKKENESEQDHAGIIDVTHADFSEAPLYKSKSNVQPYLAEELLHDETLVHSWGVQELKKGDWVLHKPTRDGGYKRSGIKRDAFLRTYDSVGAGHYKKTSYIRAIKIDVPFKFIGVDSDHFEVAPAGSYLVLNLDKHQMPILIHGKRDIFFYKEQDLFQNYE